MVRDFALLPDPAATFVGMLLPYVEICIAMALLSMFMKRGPCCGDCFAGELRDCRID